MKLAVPFVLTAAAMPSAFAYNMGGFMFGQPVQVQFGGPCSPARAQRFRQQQDYINRAFAKLQEEIDQQRTTGTDTSVASPSSAPADPEETARRQQEWFKQAFDLASELSNNSSPDSQKEILNRAFGLASEAFTGQSSPHYEIKNTDDRFQVALDVPGVDRGDIDIQVKDQNLTIRGTRRFGTDNTRDFSKTFALEANADIDNITAALNNGVLVVTVPKILKEPKSIPVV